VASIQDLIAKKNYAKALDLIRADLAKRPKDHRLRLQQADVLILAGRGKEAAPVLLTMADEHASEGFAAKAIAVLKRVEKIDPGRRDVEQRLARLIQEKVRGTPATARPSSSTPEFGLEEFDPSAEIGMAAAPAAAPVEAPAAALDPIPVVVAEPEALPMLDSEPVIAAEPDPIVPVDPEPLLAVDPEPVPVSEVPSGRASEPQPATIDDDDLEGLDYLTPEDESLEITPEPQPTLSTPLFEGLSEPELVAVMHGMNLRTFAPGDILMGEGAPGDSLFVLTTGAVKCWVKDRKGHYMKVQDLPEGAFFGEISVLTGKPRTATLTAAAHCEALELDKKTLDEITTKHPHVREVLKKFHEQRAIDTVQAMSKKRRG